MNSLISISVQIEQLTLISTLLPSSLPPHFSGENKTLPLKPFLPCLMFSVEVNCYYSISYGSFCKYGLICCSNPALTSLHHSNSFCLSNSNFKFYIWVRQKQNILFNAKCKQKKYLELQYLNLTTNYKIEISYWYPYFSTISVPPL